MNTILTIVILVFIGSVAGLAGGLVLLWNEKFARKNSIHLISFAAGVMIATAFLDLLPDAIAHGGENIFIIILAGLVLFFLAEDFILHFHHHEEHAHSLRSAVPLIAISDTIHNFVDGVVIASAFLADPKLGYVVATATFFHELPQEIGDFAVLISAGISKTKVILINLVSALASFVGAFLAIFFINKFDGAMGPLLGLATGMFLYISSADILPQLVKEENRLSRWHTAAFFLTGIALVFFLTRIIPD